VPITVWHIPRDDGDPAVPAALVRRLAANYTHRRARTVDLTSTAPVPGRARHHAELVITRWPPSAETHRPELEAQPLADHLAMCARRLGDDGCLAVVVTDPRDHDLLGAVISTGHSAGMTYLQHIVVVHHLDLPADGLPHPADAAALPEGQHHPRIHTDVVVMRRSRPGTRTGSRP
jgi:hypothetical protein